MGEIAGRIIVLYGVVVWQATTGFQDIFKYAIREAIQIVVKREKTAKT